MKTQSKPVVGYIRVSSLEQKEDGISLAAQKQKIQQWAELNEHPLLSIYSDEGISGTKTNRVGLNAALDLACEKQAVFVVYSLSRFSRSTTDTLRFTSRLQKAGGELVSISEQIDTLSAAGKMIFRVLAVLNEFESDLGSERTKVALDYRRSQGLKTGGHIPYGYYVDEDLRLHPLQAEQQVINQIKAFRQDGKSYAFIVRYLNENNVSTKTGGKWHIQTVKNILNRTTM